MIRKTIFAAALAAITLSSAACNTVQGVGDDIKSVGRAGERAID
ncbi:MAG: Entericidin EcnA/B family protein [Rhizobiales bacterium]|nr:Entericidin EcnA/B family protein [Hyphomicrobiales bacterium]